MSSSVYVDNKRKFILILHEGRAQGLGDTIDFTQSGKRFVLSLHCNGSSSFIIFYYCKSISIHSKKTQK